MTGTLDGDRQLTLMTGTGAGHTAGQDLGALGNEAAQSGNILVINGFHLVNAEAADLSAALASTAVLVSFCHGKVPPSKIIKNAIKMIG